ncbi:MAG: metallophosphoesterase [Eubacteriales bacterium]|nr:metallophosphoesterase [Eubacteriales bacterium]
MSGKMAFTMLAGNAGGVPAHHGVYPVRIVRAEPKGRLIAVSDIHGSAALLDRLLQRIDLQGEDTLVIIGDLIERGKESLKTVRMVMELCRRPNTYVLMGNMDAHKAWEIGTDTQETAQGLWYNIEKLGTSLFLDMCREIGLAPRNIEETTAAKEQVRRAFAAELEFLRTRPTILETPGWTFVHGGLPITNTDELEGTEAFECMKFDDFVQRGPVCPKPVAVGHYPTNLYWPGPVQLNPHWSASKRILTIDGGCGLRADAQLNAVFLEPDGRYSHIYEDDFPKAIALDKQEEHAPTIRFKWPDSRAEVVERSENCALMEQSGTGLRTLVPNCFWGEDERGCWVNDFSDARPEIAPGDRISIVVRAGVGYYVKKDGVSGWYFGRIDPQ